MSNDDLKKSNRATIIGVLAIFTVPVVIAWTAYFTGWFEAKATTNHGELIQPVLDFSNSKTTDVDGEIVSFEIGQPWRIILPIANPDCLTSEGPEGCLLSIYIMGQAHQALGKEQERVDRVLLSNDTPLSDAQRTQLEERFVGLKYMTASPEAPVKLDPAFIYIADPLGNIMLRFPVIRDKEDAFIKGKDIFLDLKKLLKISRIG